MTSSRRPWTAPERRKEPVGGVDQAVEVEHPGERQVERDDHGGRDRLGPRPGRPTTTTPPSSRPTQRAHEREPPNAPSGRRRTAPGRGREEGERRARTAQTRSSRRSTPGHDEPDVVGDGGDAPG